MLADYKYSDLMAFARRIYGDSRRLQMTPYTYPVDFGTLTASSITTRPLQFNANADFILLSLSQDNTANAILNNTTIFINDASTGEPYMDAGVTFASYVSNINFYSFPYPRFISGKSALICSLTTGTDTCTGLQLQFNGVLVRAMD